MRSKQPNLSDEGSNAVQSRRSGLSAASSLKLEASWIAAAALALTTLFAFLLLDLLGPAIARRWLTLACLGLLLLFASVWTNLNRNRPDDLAPLMPRLGAGTMLSILRGALIVWMAGFLAVPRLAGAAAWIPGLIFAAAISADFLDGYLARRQGMVTKLGEWLDINLDGAAVLAGILIALHAQVLPAWYLLVGLARYIFLAGIWLRVRLNRPVYELRESARRRSLAGVQMIFLSAVLLPIFDTRVIRPAAVVFAGVFLAGFLVDWLAVTGAGGSAQMLGLQRRWEMMSRYLPVLLRLLIAAALISLAAVSLLQRGDSGSAIGTAILELLLAAMLILGAAGRSAALAVLILAGLGRITLQPDWTFFVLIFCTSLIFFTGTGSWSLWSPESKVVSHRGGRDRTRRTEP